MAGPIPKIDIKDLSREELAKEVSLLRIEHFRTEQILDWVYKKYVCDFDKMPNLSVKQTGLLKEKFYISGLRPVRRQVSNDETVKLLFELEDGQEIESVFIPSKNTNTVCISTQVGCRFACTFCASGRGGFTRNLRPSEIINQALYFRKEGFDVTNVVFMGMGEPFDNYGNVLKAIKILNAPYGLGIGQRKITVSTAGVIPGIKRFTEENLQVELSISLHGPGDKIRSKLMPINKRYPVEELISACREYVKKTNRQITFEYIIIKDVNDSRYDAVELAGLIKGLISKVNLIPYNVIQDSAYAPPEPKTIKAFKGIMDKRGVVSVIRVTRGADISAACGQLKLMHETDKKGLVN
jgi:23S rRNA (adenine2503-C2)-methyltransferase